MKQFPPWIAILWLNTFPSRRRAIAPSLLNSQGLEQPGRQQVSVRDVFGMNAQGRRGERGGREGSGMEGTRRQETREGGRGPSRRVRSRLHSSLINPRSSSPWKPLNFEGNPGELREEKNLLQSQMGQPQGSIGHRHRSNGGPI